MADIGKLKRVSLRDVWRDEAKDFTTWLSDNLDVLGEIVNENINFLEREKDVGPFSADIVAETGEGHLIVIENQLERTNHDHLGKILTYLTNIPDVKYAIWISKHPRPEHISVFNWLNEITPDDMAFYMVKIEAVQIGDSHPAPLLSIIASPSREGKGIGKKKKDFAQRHNDRVEFWEGLLKVANNKTNLFSRINPRRDHWLNTGAGIQVFSYMFVILNDEARIELNMDNPDEKKNKYIFDKLYEKKNLIEKTFGNELTWRRLDDRKSSRISYSVVKKGLKDTDDWSKIHTKLVDAMIKFEKAFRSEMKNIRN